jgi:hypothetical protein
LSWEIHDVESPLNEELLPAAQEQEPDQEDGQGTEIVKRLGNCWGCIADKWDRPWWKNKFAEALRLPHKHLLYNSTQRKASYIPESSLVFSSRPSEWITSGIPYRLGALVTLLTFGVMAPLLAMVIILYLILDSYVTQLVLGRFIVTEIGNLQEYTRDLSRDKHDSAIDTVSVLETIYMSHVKKNRMKVDIYDAVKDWGARKVLEEVENQCRYVPASALSLSRRSFVIIPAIAMSFLMNDVINSASNSAGNHIWWPSLALMIFACGIELLTHAATYCYSPVPFQSVTASATASASAAESASISLGAMKAGNPIHFNAL